MKRWGRTVGFVAATAFLWAPYRALDIYVRGALSEVFALSLLPWALHFGMLFSQRKRVAWLGTSLAVAAVILSHNLTAFIALPFLFLISLGFLSLQKERSWKNLGLLLSAYLAGATLTAFYSLPLFLEKNFTIVDEITTGYFDFHLHFVYIRQLFTAAWGYSGSNYGPEDGISFHLGRVLLVSAAGSVLAATAQLLRTFADKPKDLRIFVTKEHSLVLVIITALGLLTSLFLTLTHSQFIWENIPFIAYIQFPWRYLTLASLFLSMLTGFSLLFIRQPLWRWAGMLILGIAIVVTQYQYHQPEEYLESDDEYYFTDESRIRTESSEVLFDYLPKGFNRELPPVAAQERIVINGSSPEGDWQKNLPHQLIVATEATPGSEIRWNIAHFPGWKYSVNGEEITPSIDADGLALYQAEGPVAEVGAQFIATPIRQVGNILSLLCLGFWLTVASIGQRSILKGKRGTPKNL
jgi:hypothetical protein